jgi:myo-inositol-1(or 4)-monophosphatase
VSLKPWDVAAGKLLVEEAGGKVTGFHGERYDHMQGDIVATNGHIHEELLKILGRHF